MADVPAQPPAPSPGPVFSSPPPASPRPDSSRVWIAVVIVMGVLLLVCIGGCMAFGLLGIHRMDTLREEGRENAEKAWESMGQVTPGEPAPITSAPALEAQAALERQRAQMRGLMEADIADLRRQADGLPEGSGMRKAVEAEILAKERLLETMQLGPGSLPPAKSPGGPIPEAPNSE